MPSKEYEKLSERMNELEKTLKSKGDMQKRLDAQILETETWKQKAAHSGKLEDELRLIIRDEIAKINPVMMTVGNPSDQTVDIGQSQVSIHLTQLKPEDIPADDKTLRGKIFCVMPEGKWFSTQEVFEAIKDKYAGEWSTDAPISSDLNSMVDAELLQKRKNSNRTVSYRLPDYIHIKKVIMNAL